MEKNKQAARQIQISGPLSPERAEKFFRTNQTSIYRTNEIKSILLGTNYLLNDCYLVGFVELPGTPSQPGESRAAVLVYAVDTAASLEIYPRTKLKALEELIGRHLENRTIVSAVNASLRATTKFNRMLFHHEVEKVSVPGEGIYTIFSNDRSYCNNLSKYLGR